MAQTFAPRELRAGVLTSRIVIDGVLDESAWQSADVAGELTQADPIEGAPASGATRVRVLAGSKAVVIGIDCDDAQPTGIVSFSKQRDAQLRSEDHVRVVLDTFLDGRSGYVFAVNPGGAPGKGSAQKLAAGVPRRHRSDGKIDSVNTSVRRVQRIEPADIRAKFTFNRPTSGWSLSTNEVIATRALVHRRLAPASAAPNGKGLPLSRLHSRCAAVGITVGALVLTWAGPLGAQTTAASLSAAFEIKAVLVAPPPVIDGEIGDGEWQGAAMTSNFIQYEPQRGDRSEVRTEALVLYDAGHLYVAFRAWDTEPVTAQLTQRDADLLRDDAVVVVIDTTHDRRSGYYFITNVLGTQADGRIADDGRSPEPTWDAPWQSAAKRTSYGWSAEFSVPLSSIRYVAGERATWGINFGRSRRRSLEMSFWSGPLDNQWRVSQAGRLVQLNVPPPLDRVQIVPYALTRAQENMASDWEAGIDARYAVTPTTSIYGTLFPDFATVEADQEQINLTRFEVSLPEKRQFFLEGQEQFNQRFRTFYSRRIADVTAGAKLLGKQGPWTTAFIFARADPPGINRGARYTVGRVQRDIFGRSTVAFMGADRLFDGLRQGSLSADANLFFTRTFGMTAQVLKSYGPFAHGTNGFFIRPSYDSSTAHFHVRYGDLGERVADNLNVVGQIVDDDRREVDSNASKTLWIRNGVFEQLRYASNYNIYWSHTGLLRSWKIDESFSTEFRSKFSARGSWTEEFKRFEKDFRNRQLGLDIGYNTRAYQSISAGVELGRNFDSEYVLWTTSARYKLTPGLSTEYALERLELHPDPERQSTWIHVVRANQFFTKDLFLRLFFQTNSAIDRRNVQAVFVYRYLPPFGTIQLAYQRGTAGFGERSTQGNTLFLKATTVF
jgi:hypothetical protein